MCARAGENKMKTSARRTLDKADALFLSTIDDIDGATARTRFAEWREGLTIDLNTKGLPIFTREDIPKVIQQIQETLSISQSMPSERGLINQPSKMAAECSPGRKPGD
jgi:hypothetical protein